jgi:purine nucleoside phosphorylase
MKLNSEKSISYEDIPNFPVSTVEGHQGQTNIWFIGE